MTVDRLIEDILTVPTTVKYVRLFNETAILHCGHNILHTVADASTANLLQDTLKQNHYFANDNFISCILDTRANLV